MIELRLSTDIFETQYVNVMRWKISFKYVDFGFLALPKVTWSITAIL